MNLLTRRIIRTILFVFIVFSSYKDYTLNQQADKLGDEILKITKLTLSKENKNQEFYQNQVAKSEEIWKQYETLHQERNYYFWAYMVLFALLIVSVFIKPKDVPQK